MILDDTKEKPSVEDIFKEKFKDYIISYKQASKYKGKDDNEVYLVSAEETTYWFDKIVEDKWGAKRGYSVDAISALKNNIILIEFKTGFQDNINLSNYRQKPTSTTCVQTKKHCSSLGCYYYQYYDEFFKKRSALKNELLSVLELKLMESIAFLKKVILKEYNIDDLKINYLVVVDSTYMQQQNSTIMGINCTCLKENDWDRRKVETNGGSIFCNPEENVLIENKLDKYKQPSRHLCDKIVVVSARDFYVGLEKVGL